MINVMFSYVGMDIMAATAAESKSLADAESMKMAARKINIRIIASLEDLRETPAGLRAMAVSRN